MQTLRSPLPLTTPSVVLSMSLSLALTSAGCGLPIPADSPGREHASSTDVLPVRQSPLVSCDLAGLDAAVALLASADGVALGFTERSGPEPGTVVRRYRGAGCALSPDGSAPLAVHALLDADDHGNLYAFPRATTAPGVVSTVPPGGSVISSISVVVRIDPAGGSTSVVEAGRGIWSFGISPSGGTFWSTACGPTGIFTVDNPPLRSVMKPPATRWQTLGAVLTGNDTLWSLDSYRCNLGLAAGPACGQPLVRSTPAGDRTVAATGLAGAADDVPVALSRCGARLCGASPGEIVVWGDDGAVVKTLTATDLGIRRGEQVVKVSGNRHGLYVLLGTGARNRLLFVPLPE